MAQQRAAVSVSKVNTVVELTTRQRVSNVLRDITRMQPGKDPVYLAFPVNTMMLPVRVRANVANRILFRVIKIGPCPVIHAPPERTLLKEVSNAKEHHAKPALLRTSLQEHVQSAHRVGYRKIWMPRYACNAYPAPPLCPILVEVLRAVVVTLVRLVARMAFVKIVRLGFIKIPKVKRSAVALVPRLAKYPTKWVPGVNCHGGVLAKWANI